MNVSKYEQYKARYVFVCDETFPELLRSGVYQLTSLWPTESPANERPVEVINPVNFRESWSTGSGP